MSKVVRVGLLGCGTVGGGVVRLLSQNADYFALSVGARLEIRKVLVRDLPRERVSELDRELLTTNSDDVVHSPDIDVVVEVMGGIDPTKAHVSGALARGASVVSANKMLLAAHGPELLRLAVKSGVDLAFEGAVGGGIPVIRVLREALSSDCVTSLSGIVNGTCNYMLTRMQKDGLSFDAALAEAQAKGYAEADPGLDVDGHDAAHKLVVLAMLAFGTTVRHEEVFTEGIRDIEPIDHRFAERFGFRIKHLAIGRDHGEAVELRVHPALVRHDTPLSAVAGVLNAIAVEGRALGPCLLSGRGAGDMPTAVSVVADLLDVARARLNAAAGLATRSILLTDRPLFPHAEIECRYYLRFQVLDRPGVLAEIAGALGEERVSIEQMIQEGGGDASGDPVQVVMLTHSAKERAVERALARIARAEWAAKPTRVIRIEE